MRAVPEASCRVEWLPFFLNDRIPAAGISLEQYLHNVYGPGMDVEAAAERMKQTGARVGIEFNQFKGKVTPTLDSHRLVELAKRQGKQDAMMERIFRMYFTEARPLNSRPDLVACAEEVGVTGAAAYLDSTEDVDEVKYAASQWKGSVSGVPFFIIGRPGQSLADKVKLSGAQPAAAFARVLRALIGR